eukprot:9094926-Pyramimonas_sp.AAC.1
MARDVADAWHAPWAPADLAAQARCRDSPALGEQLKIGGPALLEGEDRGHVVAEAEDLRAVERGVTRRPPQRRRGLPERGSGPGTARRLAAV